MASVPLVQPVGLALALGDLGLEQVLAAVREDDTLVVPSSTGSRARSGRA